jgi:hypothetical protein
MDRLPSADHLSALDRDIWGEDAPQGPAADPGAEVMKMMREMAGVLGEATRMILKRLDEIEDRLEAKTDQKQEGTEPLETDSPER